MDGADPFDQHAEEYDLWFERHVALYESELRAVRRLLPRSGRGLEIGIGTGRFAVPLGIEEGVEPSARMRGLARKRGLDPMDGVAEDLPLGDHEFDFVLMVSTICFVNDVGAAMKEAYRVIRPGGHIVIAFIQKDSPFGKAYETRKEGSVFYRDAQFLTAGDVVTWMEKAGFGGFEYVQTLFRGPGGPEMVEEPRDGNDAGSFLVVRGRKP